MPFPPDRLPSTSFVGPERNGEEDRHPTDEVAPTLGEAIRGDREREATRRGRKPAEPERSEPGTGCETGENDAREKQQVPGDNWPAGSLERPERDSEGPPTQCRLGLDERLEAVGIDPRSSTPLELMPGQPEPVDRLEVIARGSLSETEASLVLVGDELRADRRDRGGDGDDRGCDVQRQQGRRGSPDDSKRTAPSERFDPGSHLDD